MVISKGSKLFNLSFYTQDCIAKSEITTTTTTRASTTAGSMVTTQRPQTASVPIATTAGQLPSTTTASTTTPTTTQRPSTTTPGVTPTITQFTAFNLTVPTLPTGPTQPPQTTPFAPAEFRLQANIKPTKYELLLRTYFDAYGKGDVYDEEKITGEVGITFELTSPSNRILIHMDLDVKLTEVNIQMTNQVTGQLVQVQYYDYLRNQLFEIGFGATLTVGTYKM